jgi:XTP/dITP diphosphohydrolase
MTRSTPLDLLIATGNIGKLVEMRVLLGQLPINLMTLKDFPGILEVEESGATYEENAVLKAKGYAQQTGLWALADDSGFEVEALGRAPGVISARYAGAGASDRDRIDFLLGQLDDASDRRARFMCVAALADATGMIASITQGVCEGRVIDEVRGGNGFGYDPIFIPQGFEQTFAELNSDIKNNISHRAKALHAMRPFLEQLIRES